MPKKFRELPLVSKRRLKPLAQASGTNMLPIQFLQAEDVSNAVVWLMSDQAQWITGVTLPVDAGATNKP